MVKNRVIYSGIVRFESLSIFLECYKHVSNDIPSHSSVINIRYYPYELSRRCETPFFKAIPTSHDAKEFLIPMVSSSVLRNYNVGFVTKTHGSIMTGTDRFKAPARTNDQNRHTVTPFDGLCQMDETVPCLPAGWKFLVWACQPSDIGHFSQYKEFPTQR